jgi:hypothetical protein
MASVVKHVLVIYQVYTWYIEHKSIYLIYTWYIPYLNILLLHVQVQLGINRSRDECNLPGPATFPSPA